MIKAMLGRPREELAEGRGHRPSARLAGIAVDARRRAGDAAASRLGDHGVDRGSLDVGDRLGSPSSGETARQQLWLVTVCWVEKAKNSCRVSPAAVSRSGVVRDELPHHGREGVAASAFPRQLDLRLGDVDALGALAQQLIGENAGGSQRQWSAQGWFAFVVRREVERAERHLALPAVWPPATEDPRLVPAGLDHNDERPGAPPSRTSRRLLGFGRSLSTAALVSSFGKVPLRGGKPGVNNCPCYIPFSGESNLQ